jgi:hypothetical protein
MRWQLVCRQRFYKPDLPTVERTLLALQESVLLARQEYTLKLYLTLVDNSDDSLVHAEVVNWVEGIRPVVSDWKLHLLRAPGNVGYGRGNNLVIATASSDYHIVINPDLFVAPDALLEALRFMQFNSEVGLLSPAVYGEDGERQYLCKRNPTLLVMFLRALHRHGFIRGLPGRSRVLKCAIAIPRSRFTRWSIPPAASCFFAPDHFRPLAALIRIFFFIMKMQISAGAC